MTFRFHKSIRIIPGVRVNFSKTGKSLSVGRPGATINYNGQRTRQTVGLPGTGMSWSQDSKGRATGLIVFAVVLAVLGSLVKIIFNTGGRR